MKKLLGAKENRRLGFHGSKLEKLRDRILGDQETLLPILPLSRTVGGKKYSLGCETQGTENEVEKHPKNWLNKFCSFGWYGNISMKRTTLKLPHV